MNNKKLGTLFERSMVERLSREGYWVHFIAPDIRGAQPFDIIAVKDGSAIVFDCKTCKDPIFRIERLEDNQVMAFEKWMWCGNSVPYVAVEHDEQVYIIDYLSLKQYRKIDLRERKPLYVVRSE